jgi:ABC-2 type transport system ATP-binding protein
MNVFSGESITKQYGDNGFKLNNVSINLEAGKITGVVGENGNGKTTLLRIIAGELAHDIGEVKYFGDNSVEFLSWDKVKNRVAYIPQRIPKWHGALKDNLIFEASIRNIKGSNADALVDELVSKLGLSDYIHLKWKEISTGYRLRFQLAKMLIGSPDLLVLDEPIANLDINAQAKFLNDLRNIVSEPKRNVSVILSSQQLHQIENVSDSIVFLSKGNMLYSGEVDKIGEQRTENQFEFQGNLNIEELKKEFPKATITTEGKTFNITTGLEITSEVFLETLVAKKIKIDYFRDISSSTKKMFNASLN